MITIKRPAHDKKIGLTVAELEAFTIDVNHAGLSPDTPLKARAGFRGQIQSIEANA